MNLHDALILLAADKLELLRNNGMSKFVAGSSLLSQP
jgi:hypothetical protein